MKISGSSAIVTGAASGLGAGSARMLAREGARVALLDTQIDGARSVAGEFGGLAVYCDVTDPAGVAKALAEAAESNGLPRILIHCAGITIGRVPLVGGEYRKRLSQFKNLVQINLNGSLNMLSLVAEQMTSLEPLEQGERGVIVSTASVAAYEGQIGSVAYSASKGAIVSLTLPAARELAAYGIRVNTIAPGYFDTPLLADLPDYVRSGCADSFVFPERFGKAEEFAQLVRHIIENAMLNGETIRLDGGMRLPPSFMGQRTKKIKNRI